MSEQEPGKAPNPTESLHWSSQHEAAAELDARGMESAQHSIDVVSEALKTKTGGVLSLSMERGVVFPTIGEGRTPEEVAEIEKNFDNLWKGFPDEVKTFVDGREKAEGLTLDRNKAEIPSMQTMLDMQDDNIGTFDGLAEHYMDSLGSVTRGKIPEINTRIYTAHTEGSHMEKPSTVEMTQGELLAKFAGDIEINAELAGLVERVPASKAA